jgi:hypothetical protein
MPWLNERLPFEPEALSAARRLRVWAVRYGRFEGRRVPRD